MRSVFQIIIDDFILIGICLMWKCGLVYFSGCNLCSFFWDGFCSKSMRRIVKKIQAKGQLSNNGDRKNQLSNIGSQLAREIHAGRFKWFRFTYFLKCLCILFPWHPIIERSREGRLWIGFPPGCTKIWTGDSPAFPGWPPLNVSAH